MVRVLKYAQSLGLLLVYDGSSESFGNDQSQEVLYENTGLSRYFPVHFGRDIFHCTGIADFEALAREGADAEWGLKRSQRCYQQLALAPAMFWSEGNRNDYECIKNQRKWVSKYLTEAIGGEYHSLSKQKMKNLIHDSDNWVENPGAYKKLVNDRLYQYPDLRQFDQMVQLLIKVRAPKLSKEAFRPNMVKAVLNDSLQVLTDDDLHAMVSTMEQMDELQQTLEGYAVASREAQTIKNQYQSYNQYILGMKGKAYFEACDRTTKQRNALSDQEAQQELLRTQLQEQRNRADQAHGALARARGQRSAMGDGDLARKRRSLEEARSGGETGG